MILRILQNIGRNTNIQSLFVSNMLTNINFFIHDNRKKHFLKNCLTVITIKVKILLLYKFLRVSESQSSLINLELKKKYDSHLFFDIYQLNNFQKSSVKDIVIIFICHFSKKFILRKDKKFNNFYLLKKHQLSFLKIITKHT